MSVSSMHSGSGLAVLRRVVAQVCDSSIYPCGRHLWSAVCTCPSGHECHCTRPSQQYRPGSSNARLVRRAEKDVIMFLPLLFSQVHMAALQ